MNIDIHLVLGVLSSIVLIASSVPYIRDVISKAARPNVISWSGWALLNGIGAFAQIAKGANASVVVTIVLTFAELIIAVLAIRYGYTKFNLTDKLCFFLGAIAIALWVITREPLTALFLVILADIIVGIPTIVKTWRDPASETYFPWFSFACGAGLGLLASNNLELQNILYPAYLLCFDLTIAILAVRVTFRRRQ